MGECGRYLPVLTNATGSVGSVTARTRSRRSTYAIGLLGALALVGTACTPVLAPRPTPAPTPSQCTASVGATALAAPKASPAPLTVSQAAVDASRAAAPSDAATSKVALVTAERDDDGTLNIETHETTKAKAPAVAADVASDGDLMAVDVPHPVKVEAPDPLRPQQWALTNVSFQSVWPRYTGTGIKVAVVDSGVQANHPDLAGHVLAGAQFLQNSGTSVCNGQFDGHGHGTHVAGIIAATANNGIGISGAAPGVSILPVRVLDSNGSGWDSDVARGVDWATAHGARVINMSLGGPNASSVLQAAITNAVNHGVTVVAAAGNVHNTAGPDPASYPGAFSNVLSVAAVDSGSNVASFSTRGAYVDVAAPGVNVWSTYKGSTYLSMSGTSMATPYVSAAAALLTQEYPAWTPGHVQTCLESTATHLGVGTGRNTATGAGLINPAAAVSCH